MKVGNGTILVIPALALGLVLSVAVSDRRPAASKKPAEQAANREAAHELVSSIGMKLIRIPAGEFFMGSTEPVEQVLRDFVAHNREADDFKEEYPRHRVRITKSFFIGKFEVTVGQYRQFVEDSGYQTEPETDGTGGWGFNPKLRKCEGRKPHFNWHNTGFQQSDEHPVVNVTWTDSVKFCEWLSRKDGATYRLPTEAEWEYCCRAGTTTRYHNGNDPSMLKEVGRVNDPKGRTRFPAIQNLEIFEVAPNSFTVPVGRFQPNAFGLYDMHGNAWEWCSDWLAEDYYTRSPVDDPQGPDAPPNPEDGVRVRRGGGWNSFPLWVRASVRNFNTPNSRVVNLGFRVVREIRDSNLGPAHQ